MTPHDLAPRWRVEALEIELPAVSAAHARRLAIGEAHRRSDPLLPPWLPLQRLSWPFSSAERLVESQRPDTQTRLELAA